MCTSYTEYMTYTLEATSLTKSYGGTTVLDGLDLRVEAGTVCALLGPNGAGKTTTVRILATLLRADAGRATVAGFDVATQPQQVRAAISLTGQYAAVDEMLSGRENLVMMARLRHLPRMQVRSRVDALLAQFDLGDAADRRVNTYSGGMRRRIDLAMSLISVPAVLFLDEPTTGLDPRSRHEVWDAVEELAGSGVTVLLTTQYLDEADRLADRIAVIDGGRLVAEGTPAELKAGVGSETVELFFATPTDLWRAESLLAEPGSPDPLRDEAVLSLRVGSDGSADAVRRLLDRLSTTGTPAVRLTLHAPTLDDVFLHLTEHRDDAARPALERTA